ncbi:hypothetical protein HPB52_018598 [Rhipicephalus sanguineus]|uniref:Uncharacterized protein n=1 Tax=Rhipicephalus sanguineus TaxID=34632 RepID=A0A9D4T477_RHISA|nr:hypothetical protein HPB52_018598 [Rhipicephalus sanguineus]
MQLFTCRRARKLAVVSSRPPRTPRSGNEVRGARWDGGPEADIRDAAGRSDPQYVCRRLDRFCFVKSDESRCSVVTNIYCQVPDTRQVAVTGSGRQVPGTRLEWKLQPDGRLEVRVGPALTEEEEAKRAKAAKQASTSAGASTSAKPSGGCGSKTEPKKPGRRGPSDWVLARRAISVRFVDVSPTGPVGRVLVPRLPSLPAYVVRRRSSVPDYVAEQDGPPPLQPCVECVEELARRLAESGAEDINRHDRKCLIIIIINRGRTRARARVLRRDQQPQAVVSPMELGNGCSQKATK